jgi:putative transposase
VLGVSPSGFYAWRARPPSRHARDDAFLGVVIAAIHRASRGTYGAPRIRAELSLGHGIACSKKRIARLMVARHLSGLQRRRRRRLTRPGSLRAPDLVARSFDPSKPNHLWVTDLERHEALLDRMKLGGLHPWAVAAARVKLGAA